MDREAWRPTAHRVIKSQTQLEQLNIHYYIYIKLDKQQGPYSPGTYLQYPVITYNGKESEKKNVCITVSHCRSPETNTNCKPTILQLEKTKALDSISLKSKQII